jgi:hypothetical protein
MMSGKIVAAIHLSGVTEVPDPDKKTFLAMNSEQENVTNWMTPNR